MKRIILLTCVCFVSIFSFSETEHSLKKYFKDNILKLDPIEGAYSVSMRQWVTPSAGESSVIDGTTTWFIKKNYNEFAIYNEDGLYLKQLNIKRIGDTNAYLFNFNDYLFGYESHQFVLQNDVMFEFTHEFTPSTVKRQINNTYSIPLNRIHSYYKIRAIKSYPTSAMYLEAARKEAEQAERKAGWSGSGFALAQGHIVTNYHVVENAKTILVKGIKGDFVTEYRASVVATDKINDIAIIKISDDRFKGFGAAPYKIKRAMSDVGESVWALGYPMVGVMGDEVKFTDGKISARTGIQGDMSVYQISVPIQPGNSGGPLFDNNGNIVGITSSGLNREAFNSENVNYAIKTSYLYNLIESSMSTSILPQGTAMQGQSLTEKIKLAKKFVYIILCSEDPNFHKEESDILKKEPVLVLERTEHDFGEIQGSVGVVSTVFTFKNEGATPLVISNVSSSTNRVTVTWPKEPIEPSKSGNIVVTYNTIVPGRFQKSVIITSNAIEPTMRVYIKGCVISEMPPQTPSSQSQSSTSKTSNNTKRSVDSKGIVTIDNPLQREGSMLKVRGITINNHETIICCSFTNSNYKEFGINKNAYILCNNTQRYRLRYPISIPMLPETKEVTLNQEIQFTLIFEAIPSNSESIDIFIDNYLNAYNIQLK